MPNPRYYISLDIGGTNARVALLESHKGCQILAQTKFPVDPDFESGVRKVADEVKKLSTGYQIEGVSAGVPAEVTADGNSIDLANNLQDWSYKPIRKKLATLSGLPVTLLNDTALAGLGEAYYGHGVDSDGLIFLIWGTGFGGAKVEKLRGQPHVTPFEPGHYSADPEGELCACGLRGCPELWLGGGPLSTRLGKPLSDVSDSDEIWEKVISTAVHTVTNVLIFHPTPLVVFGGGMVQKRPALVEKVVTELQTTPRLEFFKPEFKVSQLGDDAALYGGVVLQEHQLI